MKCLPYNNLQYDKCVLRYLNDKISCSWRHVQVEDVQWNRQHRTEMDARKRGGQSTQDTVLDRAEFIITYTLVARSKYVLRLLEKEYAQSLQPNGTQPDYDFILDRADTDYAMQYRELSFCDPTGQEWIAWAKFQSIELVRRSNDGCRSTWTVTFILWSKHCRDQWCFYGNKNEDRWFESGNFTNNFTSWVSIVPPSMPWTPHVDKTRDYRKKDFTHTSPNFFDKYKLVDYQWPSCCVTSWGIRVTSTVTWPVVLYVLWLDWSFQWVQLDVTTVSAWATIVFRNDWSVHIIDPLSPLPDIDVTDQLSDRYCKIPKICPHKTYYDETIKKEYNNIIAFGFNSGSGELYFNCRDTRC